VYRERQFLRLCRHTRIVGTHISEEEQWTKINIDKKRSSYIEKDCFEKSQKYCSTGENRIEYSSWRPCFQKNKTVRREFHKSNIHGRAAIAEPLITKSNTQMRKLLYHDHKTLSNNWKRACDMVRWVVLHVVPYIRKSLRLENTLGSLQCGMPASKNETRGGSMMVGTAISCFLLVPLLFFMDELLQGSAWTGWIIRCIPWSRSYFLPNNDAVFQDDNVPIYTAGTVYSWSEQHEGELQHRPWPAQLPDLNIAEPLWSVSETRMMNRSLPPISLK
jgi:hypothetical protein